MAFTVQELIDNVRVTLQDEQVVRWSDQELIDWINDAARACVVIKPDCNPITAEFTCVAGYKQDFSTLSTELVTLLEVTQNTTTGGNADERPITFVKRNVMDSELPTWRTTAASSTILYYMYDEQQRDVMYVYPPANVGATIELVFSGVPTAVTATTDDSPLQDIYAPAITNYVLWRAYNKDMDFSGNVRLAGGYYGAFYQALTGKTMYDREYWRGDAPERHVPVQAVEEAG